MTTNNHPAHGPVSLDRLHQISEILSKAAAQSDLGSLGYAMADAVKVIDGAIAAFGAGHISQCDSRKQFEEHFGDGTTPGMERVPPFFVEMMKDAFWTVWEDSRAAMLQDGNSPVIPDGWVLVSKRMPEGMKTVITSNGFDIGQGWWDGECWKSFDCHDVVPGKVTHWMPLPAAPQQEVKP
ncbi:TPA: DUF551 domain-containing protein [Citrobacter freundii]|uniref:DUF551 domain-containing protein n=1 Tax=Citrobacter freundii TaxID=546 RepID=UPI0012A95467|nr:DUF551 domain-containing protein [Citrobacter freundii]EKX9187366.1 DUF551 domain-containing protein [Citrobacter freundii]QFI11545.1 DUF551 domain-containing protein [Citrobacter freundii]QFI27931.1 DUF551 domain-containing protein [Citrobacter freundii]HAT2734597.1 DUF551 domain-containing protein [Citrobacter freundii]HAT2739699.1 DUF551 domain-containing protein [Citrobacter freundii]